MSNKKEERPSFHSPMFLQQFGKLHYETLGGYGKVEIAHEFLDSMDEVMMLDVVSDWISELENWRANIHSEVYPSLKKDG